MSRMQSRIEKLERLTCKPDSSILVLYQIHSVDGSVRYGPALSPGVGQIDPTDAESEHEFLRRAYAMHLAQRLPSEMTNEELHAALLLADEALEQEEGETNEP